MSECIGPGCTSPGCSGRNADQINAYARASAPAEPVALQPNRADRRAAKRAGVAATKGTQYRGGALRRTER